MKRNMVNVFATTGISLALLSVVALFYNAEYLCLQTVFQVLGINIVIHLGFLFLHRLPIKSLVLGMALDVALIIGALLVFGAIFHWFTSTPVWVLIILGVVMYIVSLLLDLLEMKKEAGEINAIIRKRDGKREEE